MTLEASDLERVFEREHRFRAALLSAAEMSEPKPSIWSGLFPFLLKAVPADLVRTMIVDGGKTVLSRRKAAEEDQPQEAQEPKQPPVPHGRPKEADSRSSVSFVGTLDDDTAVETAKP